MKEQKSSNKSYVWGLMLGSFRPESRGCEMTVKTHPERVLCIDRNGG